MSHNSTRNLLVTLLLAYYKASQVAGHRAAITSFHVPNMVQHGSDVWLNCSYDLAGQNAYSLQWYKDDKRFFRIYDRTTDEKRPSIDIYERMVPELIIDTEKLLNHFRTTGIAGNVPLMNVGVSSSGNYTCEVVIGDPAFVSVKKQGEMRVLPASEELSISLFHVPEQVEHGSNFWLNCSYDVGKERAYILKWYKDGREFFRLYDDKWDDAQPKVGIYQPVQGFEVDTDLLFSPTEMLVRESPGDVRLKNVNEDGSGLYTCEVSSQVPPFKTVREKARLVVRPPPDKFTITYFRVPKKVKVGYNVWLNCSYTLGKERFYNMKWYKDGQEFYRLYTEEDAQKTTTFKTQFFRAKGVKVDLKMHMVLEKQGIMGNVYLLDVNYLTSGIYTCEVNADAPTFLTTMRSSQMVVVDNLVEGDTEDEDKSSDNETMQDSTELLEVNVTTTASTDTNGTTPAAESTPRQYLYEKLVGQITEMKQIDEKRLLQEEKLIAAVEKIANHFVGRSMMRRRLEGV